MACRSSIPSTPHRNRINAPAARWDQINFLAINGDHKPMSLWHPTITSHIQIGVSDPNTVSQSRSRCCPANVQLYSENLTTITGAGTSPVREVDIPDTPNMSIVNKRWLNRKNRCINNSVRTKERDINSRMRDENLGDNL